MVAMTEQSVANPSQSVVLSGVTLPADEELPDLDLRAPAAAPRSRRKRRGRLLGVGLPRAIGDDQSSVWMEPNRPSASSLMPAAKYTKFGSPPRPPLPTRRPHRPSIWIAPPSPLPSW